MPSLECLKPPPLPQSTHPESVCPVDLIAMNISSPHLARTTIPKLSTELLDRACHIAEVLGPCTPHERSLILCEAQLLRDETGEGHAQMMRPDETDSFMEATVDWFEELLRTLSPSARSDLLRLLSEFQRSSPSR